MTSRIAASRRKLPNMTLDPGQARAARGGDPLVLLESRGTLYSPGIGGRGRGTKWGGVGWGGVGWGGAH